MNEKYKDIIDKEYNGSKTHPKMSAHDRAAQFAPFAALAGHGSAIRAVEEKVSSFEDVEHDEKSLREEV